jgi:hypothetical protein
MVDKEVASTVFVAKFVAVHMPTILTSIEIAVPVVLADKVSHKLDFF